MHHIIGDAWSFGVLIREIATLYAAFTQATSATLTALPIQYADYAVWQRQQLQGERLTPHLAYWQQQLASAPPMLALPTDRPRPARQSFRGATQRLRLPLGLSSALKALSRREGATLFMTLLAAFQTLLARCTGQHDIVVGTSVANRTRPELEGLIGLFVNTLALRSDLSGNPRFHKLLQRVCAVALEGYAHQELPFEKLVEVLQPERNLSYTLLFQVMFALVNTPLPRNDRSAISFTRLEIDSPITQFDLTLEMTEVDDALTAIAEYSTDLFDDTTITRLLGHFQTLLEGIVADPTQHLAELALLSPAERQQLLFEWSTRPAVKPCLRCYHELLSDQAIRTPDSVALVYTDLRQPVQHLTYAELDQRANQLAHYLRALGVGPEVRVGICLDRSCDLIVAMFGVLKAGGAYTPLDPTYPHDRLRFMLEDAQITLLIAHERLAGALPESTKRVLYLDAERERIARAPAQPPVGQVTPENLAYLIYTSGSTGSPKGVLVPHRGLGNVIQEHVELLAMESSCRMLQFSTISFDAILIEVGVTLFTGATLVLAPSHVQLSGPDLLQLIRSQAITNILLPPAVLSILPFAELPALHTITVVGEVCPVELVERWAPGRRFCNAYGPTEVTVAATTATIFDTHQTPALGRPIANMRLYVLDVYQQPVPIGVVGEAYVGGVGVARGYHRRPDLTAERFVPNPYIPPLSHPPAGGHPPLPSSRWRGGRGGVLYRTGDLARFLPDGNLEFVGRVDYQVKLRGVRIELGEIEAVLRQQADVREAMVLLRNDTPGNPQLVAYVVPHQGSGVRGQASGSEDKQTSRQADKEEPNVTLSPGHLVTLSDPRSLIPALRTYLQTKLPDYMIPAVFVPLSALPLLSNGKLDRRAQLLPDQAQSTQPRTYVAPRTPVETLLANLWREVLHVEQVGSDDNFFELGGHSLLATQVISRLRDVFGMDLPPRTLFEAPTIADLAARIEEIRQPAAQPGPELVPDTDSSRTTGSLHQDQLDDEEFDRMLTELELRSEEEVQLMLAERLHQAVTNDKAAGAGSDAIGQPIGKE
jgi:amino acid adenylation domain-containing protein